MYVVKKSENVYCVYDTTDNYGWESKNECGDVLMGTIQYSGPEIEIECEYPLLVHDFLRYEAIECWEKYAKKFGLKYEHINIPY